MVMPYSVVIPAFNAEKTLREAVQSVLAQTVAPEHIVIVDDGSSDKTSEIAASLSGPVILIRQENKGPGAATTAGFARVKTPFIATIDADDIWLETKIEQQFTRFEADPELAASFCKLANFHDDPSKAEYETARGGWSRSTMLIKREACEAIGPIIDPIGRAGEMVDWFARGLEQGLKMEVMEEPLALRRIHSASLTYSHQNIGASYLHVARAALMRRRAAQKADDT